jgi:DNA-binding GntR family transcriptional regulator
MVDKELADAERIPFTLNRTILSNHIREFIIEGILNGRFTPGERIVESGIANELGVSQGPVREAIRELVVMGFLNNEPYKGTFIRKFSQDELNEVYDIRAALESLGARQAALRITDQDGEILQKIFEDMIAAARANDLHGTVNLNNQFHETIIKISGNSLLLRLWKTLQFGHWTIFTTTVSDLGLEFLAQRHKPLIDALLSRDPEAASEAMRKHIEELGTAH